MNPFSRAPSDTHSATTDSATEIQPRSSLLAFWRRLTSISQRNQSPVLDRYPDQCVASSSSDMARSWAEVCVGGNDIERYLLKVMRRYDKTAWSGQTPDPRTLTEYGYLMCYDIPRLVALVRALRDDDRKAA